MNYKSELRGFSLDRAIRVKELRHEAEPAIDIFELADKIVDYLYIPDKDIQSHLDSLIPLITQHGDVKKLEELILNLEQIKAEMEAGIKQGA